MTYFPQDHDTLRAYHASALHSATEWEKLGDQSWLKAMLFTDEFCAKLNYKAAMEAYDFAASGYRQAERYRDRIALIAA